MLFKATLEDLNRWSMNYIVRKGIPSLYRITDKRKQERVSVGSRAKQLKVMRNTLTYKESKVCNTFDEFSMMESGILT